MTGITDDLIDATAALACIEADKINRAGAGNIASPKLALAVLHPKVKAAAAVRGITDKEMVNFLTAGAIIVFQIRVAL
jgi:hypothetical protein